MSQKPAATIARRLAAQMWGEIQRQRKLANGVWLYNTPGHGGIVVDVEQHPIFKDEKTIVLEHANSRYYLLEEQHFAAFEEDCEAVKPEWLIPAMRKRLYTEFNVDIPFEEWWAKRVSLLRKSLENWNKDFLKKYPEPFEEVPS